jgi:Rod binding domain-containing protein
MSADLNVPLLTTSPLDLASGNTAKPDRLHKAAQEFEALLVGEMLKSARESGSDGWLGSGESTGDDSAMDMAESQLANALASSGGLGLATTIERAMTKTSGQKTADTQPAGLAAGSLKNQ